jgi:hypothetical protein
MRQYVLGGVILLLALAGAAYIAWPTATVQQRAMAAYSKGDYVTALPLLRQWAAQCGQRRDVEGLKSAVRLIAETELRVSPAPATSGATTGSATTLAAGGGAARQTAGAGTGGAAPSAQDVNARIKSLLSASGTSDVPMGADRVPHTKPRDGEVLAMTIKQMANFNFNPDKDSVIPKDIFLLDGVRIKLRGFMIPINQAEQITDFALVPSLVSCCFGQPPGVQHTITCRTPKGKAISYTIDEIYVEGTLHVSPKKDEGYTYSIFEMDVASVKLAG